MMIDDLGDKDAQSEETALSNTVSGRLMAFQRANADSKATCVNSSIRN